MTTFEVNGVRLAVAEDGTGRPVLLLHGFTGTNATWSELLPRLRSSHRTVAPDLLGHGGSDRPADPTRYALERQAADLASLLTTLAAPPADIVGYSMGARLALRLVLDHPHVARRLVLESPSAGIADPTERTRRSADDLALADGIERDGIEAFVDAWQAMELFATQASLPAEVRARIRHERLSQEPSGLANAVRGAGPGAMEPLHERLGEIVSVTLVIAGERDAIGLERACLVAAGIPGARLEIVPEIGHAPHLEAPEAFAGLVVPFLAASH
jgi:2-succinyl-6-hydroxy-2,4-cyclohexadiene-1-carboxylate synthase